MKRRTFLGLAMSLGLVTVAKGLPLLPAPKPVPVPAGRARHVGNVQIDDVYDPQFNTSPTKQEFSWAVYGKSQPLKVGDVVYVSGWGIEKQMVMITEASELTHRMHYTGVML